MVESLDQALECGDLCGDAYDGMVELGAEVVSQLGHQVREAEECIGLHSLESLFESRRHDAVLAQRLEARAAGVGRGGLNLLAEDVVDWGEDLIHALNVAVAGARGEGGTRRWGGGEATGGIGRATERRFYAPYARIEFRIHEKDT